MAANNNLLHGEELQLFFDDNGTIRTLAFATNHTLTLSTSPVAISSKDHGAFAANEAGSIEWSISADNLYADDYDFLFDLMIAREPVDVVFAQVANWSPNGLESTGGDVKAWTPDQTNYRSGKAVITNLTLNAPNGEIASYTIELQGAGPLMKATNP